MASASDLSSDRLQKRLIESFLKPEDEDERYEILENIGSGAFADVIKICEKCSGVNFAIKACEFDINGERNGILKREIMNIIQMKQHVNIVKLHDVFRAKCSKLLIVMELCNMDLECFLKNQQSQDFQICTDIATQLSEGITFLHNHNPQIIHRDIKPSNILLCQTGNNILVKISDFNLSSTNESIDIAENATQEQIRNAIRSLRSTTGHGTLPFMAPEIFAGRDGVGLKDGKLVFDASVDIFAQGLVYLNIFCFDNHYAYLLREGISDGLGEDMYEARKNGEEIPEAVDLCDADSYKMRRVKHLILRMTSYERNLRPSAREVHQLITSLQCVMTLKEASEERWMKQAEIQLQFLPYSKRFIKQQLWCCCGYDGIIVLDTDLQQQRTIPAGDMGWVYDVAEMSSGDVIIPANSGLFHADTNGKRKSCINPADCPRIAVHRDQVYAFMRKTSLVSWLRLRKHWSDSNREENILIIYSYDGDGKDWVTVRRIETCFTGTDSPLTQITLSVKNDQIKCCSAGGHKIAVYSLTGKLIQTYNTRGRTGVAQHFDWPFLCSDDDDGSVLVADHTKGRLLVMIEEGEFHVLQLQPQMSEQRSAALFNDRLYVMSGRINNITLCKYSSLSLGE